MRDTGIVYALRGPGEDIRYIGSTINPQTRLSNHISEARNTDKETPKLEWLRGLLAKGERPSFEVLAKLPTSHLSETEACVIKRARKAGFDLVNSSDQGFRHTEESIRKISKARSGIEAWNRGEDMPDEQYEHLEETYWTDPGWREKQAEGMRGDDNPATRPEVRRKISEAIKEKYDRGEMESPAKRQDVREKLSEHMEGDANPAKNPEVREKMSVGVQEAHERGCYTEESRRKNAISTTIERMKNPTYRDLADFVEEGYGDVHHNARP